MCPVCTRPNLVGGQQRRVEYGAEVDPGIDMEATFQTTMVNACR